MAQEGSITQSADELTNSQQQQPAVIVYQRRFIRIAEYWNGEEPCSKGVDIERYFQQTHRIDGMFCRDFYTILIDLLSDPETLLAAMKRDTRYEIRRAEREGFSYDFLDGNDTATLDEFCNYFDEFAQRKNQPGLRRAWLSVLAQSGAL